MSIISTILSGGVGELIKGIGSVVDNLHTSKEEKNAAKLALEELARKSESDLELTLRAELGAKERILVAELQQGDAYTKRARPTIVYTGLAIAVFNAVVPLFGVSETVNAPVEFWYGWAAVVSIYSIGRTREKSGARDKVTTSITGRTSILD